MTYGLCGQDTASDSDTLRKDALNVFMDATDYIKKEIPYINYVRDRKVADVYIIWTEESTGSGGYVSTFFIVGQGKYTGMTDTIKCNMSPDDTYEIRRAKEVKTLKMGLMRYIAKTPLSQYMNITFTQPIKETVSSDKWNSWVYSVGINAYSSGQKHYNSSYLYSNISANRITEKSKFQSSLGIDLEGEKSRFIDEENNIDTTYKKITRDEDAYLSYVLSLNNHWSVGVTSYFQTSYYNNLDYSIKLSPGIEYDVFPYSESTRRKFTLLYYAGIYINDYMEETTRFKEKETLGFHSLSASLSVIQKWGSVSSSLTWSNYFFDWTYNKLNLYTSASLRLFKGLSFNIYGSFSLIHDQISLPRQGASLEDVLLRRKAQETSYSYYTSFGFTYTFGSIYNNVVNPRFNN